MTLEKELATAQRLPHERRAELVFAVATWLACIRERHLQRSVLAKLGTGSLWGVCTQGKKKPGFAWGMLRYSATGIDIGHLVWEASIATARTAKGPIHYAIAEEDGRRVTPGSVANTVRYLLDKYGIKNPEIFTVRGLRRAQPTILG